MKKNMLNLIRESATNERSFRALNNIYSLNEQLQYATDLMQMAEDIFSWLKVNFNVDNMTFSLFNIEKNTKEIMYKEGEDFYLDDELATFFIVNTHTHLNAIISFNTNSRVHYEVIQRDYNIIQAAFFQITPIIQSGILKKNFIEAQSIDSVTNVHNRQYLTRYVKKLLSLTGNENKKLFFLMIGIDHLKAVVDEFDYDVGDKVLVELAKVIYSNISKSDVVARLTGDEFLVVILSQENIYDVEEVAKDIIEDFSKIEVCVNSDYTLKKTVCIGIKDYSNKSSINLAIKDADIALYEAKNKGRSVFQNFDEIKEEDAMELF